MNPFYNNLRQQFEYLREAQIQFDKCVNNLTGLMEQAAHMFSDVADVLPLVAEEGPAVPNEIDFNSLPPLVTEANSLPTSPPWPMPSSSLAGSPMPTMVPSEEPLVNDAPMPGLEVRSHTLPNPVVVSYKGNINQPSFGTVTYE